MDAPYFVDPLMFYAPPCSISLYGRERRDGWTDDDGEQEQGFEVSHDERATEVVSRNSSMPEQEQGIELSLIADSSALVSAENESDDDLVPFNEDDDEDEYGCAPSEKPFLSDSLVICLSTIYTTASVEVKGIVEHTFHYKGTDIDDVHQHFHATFPENAFTADGHPSPEIEGIRRVVDVLQPELDRVTLEYNRVAKKKKELSARINNAIQHKKKLDFLLTSQKVRDFRNLDQTFNSKVNRELSADGGDTNAQLTPGSMARIARVLKEDFDVGSEDIICDGGCSFNSFCAYMAIEFDCRVFGIEYIVNRQYLGSNSYLQYHERAGKETNLRIAFIPTNLFKMETFLSASVVYLFDEAFPPELYKHVCTMIANTPSIKVVITFKPSKKAKMMKYMREIAGFECKKEEVVRKKGEGGKSEANTIYYCARIEGEDGHAKPLPTFDWLVERVFLTPVWDGTAYQQRQLYNNIHDVASKEMEPARRVPLKDGKEKVSPDDLAKCLVESVRDLSNVLPIELPSPKKKRSRRKG